MKTVNLVSISGGKDSTATLLNAIEQGVPNIKAVFADTGHEHQITYEYINYLEQQLGIEIVRVKPDFTQQIEKKRVHVKKHWFKDLVAGKKGQWKAKSKTFKCIKPPKMPKDPYGYVETPLFEFKGGAYPMTKEAAQARVDKALDNLKTTGNPFLDMCIWKGRFPSSKARFCTEELKKKPIQNFQESLFEEYDRINVWIGVRRDESIARSKITEEWELEFGDEEFGIWLYRPILDWTVEDVFTIHKKHNIEPNPLYKMGMGRVGCMPCVMCNKAELKAIGERCSSEIDRVAEWELKVANTAKRGNSTFFHVGAISGIKDNNLICTEKHGIHSAVKWAQTSKGGRQYNMFAYFEDESVCTSVYGLCE